jgi:hypothetical protein
MAWNSLYEITPPAFAILLNGFSGFQGRWIEKKASAFCTAKGLAPAYSPHIEIFTDSAISFTEFIAFLSSAIVTVFATLVEKWRGSSSGLSIALLLTVIFGVVFIVWFIYAISTYGAEISAQRIRRLSLSRRVGKAYGWTYPTVFRVLELILNLALIVLVIVL